MKAQLIDGPADGMEVDATNLTEILVPVDQNDAQFLRPHNPPIASSLVIARYKQRTGDPEKFDFSGYGR